MYLHFISESSSSDPIYFAEPVSSPIPAQIAVSGCQTSDGNHYIDFCIMLIVNYFYNSAFQKNEDAMFRNQYFIKELRLI